MSIPTLSRRQWMRTAAAFGGVSWKAGGAPPQRPNIVVVLGDDLGYGDLGCYGQTKIRTPHIDRLAASGLRFTEAYSGATVCSPSRCVLMTGLHTGHSRIRGNFCLEGGVVGSKGSAKVRRANLKQEDKTIGNYLQSAGYRTGLIGKWHLDGYDPSSGPLNRGFDEFHGWLTQTASITSGYYPEKRYHGREMIDVPENQNGKQGLYETDLTAKEAAAFIRANAEKPFFLFVGPSTPHSPVVSPGQGSYASREWPSDDRTYAAMVERLDALVGTVTAAIHDAKLEENTLILFGSDNGPRSEPTAQLTQIAEFFDSNGPVSGYKRDHTDGGIRVPWIASWPGVIRPNTTTDQPVYFADLVPTAVELAGGHPPKVDGVSILPILKGGKLSEDRYLYWETYEPEFGQAIRWREWKGIRRTRRSAIELYNIRKDIGETHNVAGEHPEIVKRLDSYLRAAHEPSPEYPVRLAD